MPNIIRIRKLDKELNLNGGLIIPVDHSGYTTNVKQINLEQVKEWVFSGYTGSTSGTSGISGTDGISGHPGADGTSGTSPCHEYISNIITISLLAAPTTTTTTLAPTTTTTTTTLAPTTTTTTTVTISPVEFNISNHSMMNGAIINGVSGSTVGGLDDYGGYHFPAVYPGGGVFTKIMNGVYDISISVTGSFVSLVVTGTDFITAPCQNVTASGIYTFTNITCQPGPQRVFIDLNDTYCATTTTTTLPI